MATGAWRGCYIVDDDDAFRDSIIALLFTAGYEPRGFATTAAFLKHAADLAPAPLLLDVRMSGTDGLSLLERFGYRLQHFAIIMISGHADIERAVRSIKAGAIDFVEKPIRSDGLLALLAAAQETLEIRLSRSDERNHAKAKVTGLSPREFEVLSLMLRGAPNKIVARTLDLSVRTVEMHRAHMLAKLKARSTAEALHIAMQAEVTPWPCAASSS